MLIFGCAFFMSKYTNEIKITIINDILNNLISFNEASRKYLIDVS